MKASDNQFPQLLLSESGVEPSTPATGVTALHAHADGTIWRKRWTGSEERIDELFIGASIYHTANQPIATATDTPVTYSGERFDDFGMHDNSLPNKLTIRHAGKWEVGSNATFASNATGDRGLKIRKNGAAVIAEMFVRAASARPTSVLATSGPVILASGDTLEALAWQDSGGWLDITTSSEVSPALWAEFLGA